MCGSSAAAGSIPVWLTSLTTFAWGPFSFPMLTARPRSPSATSLRRGLAAASAVPYVPHPLALQVASFSKVATP